MYETIIDDDPARRQAFIAEWRARMAALEPKRAAETPIDVLVDRYRREPVVASRRLLVSLGLDPFIKAYRGLDDHGFQKEAAVFDDTLPD